MRLICAGPKQNQNIMSHTAKLSDPPEYLRSLFNLDCSHAKKNPCSVKLRLKSNYTDVQTDLSLGCSYTVKFTVPQPIRQKGPFQAKNDFPAYTICVGSYYPATLSKRAMS